MGRGLVAVQYMYMFHIHVVSGEQDDNKKRHCLFSILYTSFFIHLIQHSLSANLKNRQKSSFTISKKSTYNINKRRSVQVVTTSQNQWQAFVGIVSENNVFLSQNNRIRQYLSMKQQLCPQQLACQLATAKNSFLELLNINSKLKYSKFEFISKMIQFNLSQSFGSFFIALHAPFLPTCSPLEGVFALQSYQSILQC